MTVVSTVLREFDSLKLTLNWGQIINYPCWEYVGNISQTHGIFISTSVRHYQEISTPIPPGEHYFSDKRLQVMALEVFFNALTAVCRKSELQVLPDYLK